MYMYKGRQSYEKHCNIIFLHKNMHNQAKNILWKRKTISKERSFALLNIQKNVKDKINSKLKVNTKCHRNNKTTNISTALAVF